MLKNNDDYKKALLLVSFGTSHTDTKEKSLDVIYEDMKRSFPDTQIFYAWTSKVIIKILAKRDGIHVPTIAEAMEQIRGCGIKELVVQPTHVINGYENEDMIETVLAGSEGIDKVAFGAPLLSTEKDEENVIRAIMNAVQCPDDTAVVWMGHGTTHEANAAFHSINDRLKVMGYSRAFLATVEANPSMDPVIEAVKQTGVHKVILIPFMMVAGDHAKNDMAGDSEDSWKTLFENAGFEVECRLNGMGELAAIREIFIDHAKAVMI